jgi:transposase
MLAPYNQDLRWRVIWLAEIVGLDLLEVSFLIQLLERTIRRYVKKFRELRNVSTAIIGRPHNCIAIHPHEELVIFEILQQYPEKTLGEVLDKLYEETGSQYACSTLYYYLKRNNITHKKVSKSNTANNA